MKTTPLKIGGRSFSLAFTLDAMCQMEDAIEGFDISKLSEFVRSPKGLKKMVFIMAGQGELLEGRILDVDEAWFGSHISPAPGRIASVQVAVLAALSEGLSMETDDGNEGEKDVVLEELKKKETAAG